LEKTTAQLTALTKDSCQQLTQKISEEQEAVGAFVTQSLQQDQPTGNIRLMGVVKLFARLPAAARKARCSILDLAAWTQSLLSNGYVPV
jgi:hypothetical protein